MENQLQSQPVMSNEPVVVQVPVEVQIIHQFMQKMIKLLKSFQSSVYKLNHRSYPIDSFIKTWQSLTKKVQQRVQWAKKGEFVVINDCVSFILPKLLWNCAEISLYNVEDNNGNIDAYKVIWGQLDINSLGSRQSVFDVTIKDILEIPLVIVRQLRELLMKYVEYPKVYIDTQEDQKKKEIPRIQINNIDKTNQLIDRYLINIKNYQSVDQLKNEVIQGQFKPLNAQEKPKIKYLFRWLIHWKLKKRCKKANKRINDRHQKIKQLIKGQQNYIQCLNNYIRFVKQPIIAQKILSHEQQMRLFSTIQQIRNFHIMFHQQLKQRYTTYHKYQTYGDLIKSYIPYFKLYLEYIYNVQKAQIFLVDLEKSNPKVAEILDRFVVGDKKYIASNELTQPTFRIAKYELLTHDAAKLTNPDHADHQLLTQACDECIKTLTSVNETVDRIMRSNRLHELQMEYGTQKDIIYTDKRQFLAQFQLHLLCPQYLLPVILVCFNDMLIVIQISTRKIIRRIKIDQKFFVKRQEDSKSYRNMVTVHSEGYITFTAGNKDANMKKAIQLYELLHKLEKNQMDGIVQVSVLGTEEIGSTSFAKHTEYIVQVKYFNLKKLLHIRFSSMSSIVSEMQRLYSDNLKIAEDQSLRKSWFNNHLSKTIQDRKRIIAQILQKLFNHERVIEQPHHLLSYLQLPLNFYKLARQSFNKKISALQACKIVPEGVDRQNSLTASGIESLNLIASEDRNLLKSGMSRKQEREAFTILCATEIKLGRDLFHDKDMTLVKLKQQAPKIEIYITTMMNEQSVMVRVTEYDTVQDVCNKMSKLIGLRSNRDFRLFHQIGKKELRVLQHQQIITKLFKFPKKAEQLPIIGLFASITNAIKKVVSPETYPTLIFKKYYYLPYEIQHSEVKKDLTRLRLIVYQIFAEIRSMKYQLNLDDYLLFAAMLVYIESQGNVSSQIDQSYVHRVVPETIFKLRNYSQQEWIIKIQPQLQRLASEIDKIIVYNSEQIKLQKIRAESVSKHALYFGRQHLCSQMVLNKIKNNPVFGSNIFYVQPHAKTYEMLQADGLKVAYNIWLAVKVESLNLLTPSSKKCLLELQYKDIEKIEVLCEAIKFKMEDYIGKEYRLNTYQSFEISQLVKYNKALNEILRELDNNTQLNARVKEYRDDLIRYRSTYEKGGTYVE